MSSLTSRTPLPNDRLLPGLAELLDADRFAAAATKLLPAGESLVGCRLEYLRYKPGTNAVAAYSLVRAGHERPLLVHGKCHTSEDYETARNKAAEGRLIDTSPVLPMLACDDSQLILFTFPNDQMLSGLRFAASAKRLQRTLYTREPALKAEDWRISDSRMVIAPIRFKPEKRTVLQVDTRARHRTSGLKKAVRFFVRVDASDDGTTARVMQDLSAEFASRHDVFLPRVIAHVSDENTTLVADLGGEAPAGDLCAAVSAGQALAAIHTADSSGLIRRDRDLLLETAVRASRGIGVLVPGLERDCRNLLSRLETRLGDHFDDTAEGFVHGDYHPGQLLKLPAGPGLLDFDRSHRGIQATDLGNFQAHQIWAALAAGLGMDAASAHREAFVTSYQEAGGQKLSTSGQAFWTAYGLLQLAPTPFRILHRKWPELMTGIIAAAGRELA